MQHNFEDYNNLYHENTWINMLIDLENQDDNIMNNNDYKFNKFFRNMFYKQIDENRNCRRYRRLFNNENMNDRNINNGTFMLLFTYASLIMNVISQMIMYIFHKLSKLINKKSNNIEKEITKHNNDMHKMNSQIISELKHIKIKVRKIDKLKQIKIRKANQFKSIPILSDDDIEDKSQTLYYNMTCSICLNKISDIIFDTCGHYCCSGCSSQIHNCHICRKSINQKIKLYGIE